MSTTVNRPQIPDPSQNQNPLQHSNLSATVLRFMTYRVAEQARTRIREEMRVQQLSQRDVADLLKWSQSRVAKLLNNRVQMGLDDLEALCFAVGVTPTEAVRDRGLEFCADLTPLEMRLLDAYRKAPKAVGEMAIELLRTGARNAELERLIPAHKKRPRTS